MKRASHCMLFVPALLAGCANVATFERYMLDPIVTVHGPTGDELAVSTDYGVVFLGRGAQTGRIEFTAWFGDGPSREEGVIEALGGGLFATESEIELPSVPLSFRPPPLGSSVLVRGRRGGVPFEIEARLAADARVSGLLLEPNDELEDLTDAELGAGIFQLEAGQPLRLLGLISGRLELSDGRSYVTAIGPEDLWRLVVHRRNVDRPRRWVYREDVL